MTQTPPEGFVLVPIYPNSYSWYIDYLECPPFKMIEENRSFVVMDNPKRNLLTPVGDEESIINKTFMCEWFPSKEEARSFLRFKNAEFLYKAMLSAAPQPPSEQPIQGLAEAIKIICSKLDSSNTCDWRLNHIEYELGILIQAARRELARGG